MKKRELYCIFAVCLLMLSSCLGDSNVRITVGLQEAVYQARPSGFFARDGRFLYGSNLGVSGDDGDCFLIEYSFDSSSPELQNSDSLSIEMLGYSPVDLWPLDNRMTDTLVVLKNEILTESLLGRNVYIDGRLFLWSNHTEAEENQVDSFMISYNPEQLYTTKNNTRIYNLYLRAVKQVTEEEGGDGGDGEGSEEGGDDPTIGTAVRVLRTNAFNIEAFYDQARQSEERMGGDTLNIAINYAAAYNKDTTACIWDATDPIRFPLNRRSE